jgi:transposase
VRLVFQWRTGAPARMKPSAICPSESAQPSFATSLAQFASVSPPRHHLSSTAVWPGNMRSTAPTVGHRARLTRADRALLTASSAH